MRRLFVALALCLSLSCASFQTNEKKAVDATDVVVTAAMNAYGDAYRAGKTTAAFDANVKAFYTKYEKAAEAVALANVAYDEAVKAKADPANAQVAIEQALAALSQAAADVIAFVKGGK